MDKIAEIIAHPELYPVELAVLIAIVIVLLLIIITIVLFFYSKYEKKPIPIEEKLRVSIVGLFSALVIFILASYVPITYFSGGNSCFRCHNKKELHLETFESAHRGIACRECHVEKGIIGTLSTHFKMSGKLLTLFVEKKKTVECCLSYDNCYECHDGIADLTLVKNRIIVRHKDFLKEKQECQNCHPATLKKQRIVTPQRIMANCGRCHNGITAAANCETCHTNRGAPPLITPDLSRFPKVFIKNDNPLIEATQSTDLIGEQSTQQIDQ